MARELEIEAVRKDSFSGLTKEEKMAGYSMLFRAAHAQRARITNVGFYAKKIDGQCAYVFHGELC